MKVHQLRFNNFIFLYPKTISTVHYFIHGKQEQYQHVFHLKRAHNQGSTGKEISFIWKPLHNLVKENTVEGVS
jgi:hypothetical protein